MASDNQADIHAVNWDALPQPEDDGGAKHLENLALPPLALRATSPDSAGNSMVDLSELSGLSIVFAYPMTANPDIPLPENWDMIPGARGCTPQACVFRDTKAELRAAGADRIFGLSVQSSNYQREAAERLHLPYPLLSDENGEFRCALKLPTMEVEGMTLLRRLILAVRDGRIEKVWYPVFPPDQSAELVLNWLK